MRKFTRTATVAQAPAFSHDNAADAFLGRFTAGGVRYDAYEYGGTFSARFGNKANEVYTGDRSTSNPALLQVIAMYDRRLGI